MKKQSKMRKRLYRLLWVVLGLFLLVNILAAFHAWSFTHFGPSNSRKPHDEVGLSFSQKLSALISGVRLPRPENRELSALPYQTVVLDGPRKIEGWWIPRDSSKGTVMLCHGYGSSKSMMLSRAYILHDLGYSTFLFDFPGAGGSPGNTCTIGYRESADVLRCLCYLKSKGEKDVVLFGTSMGAVAIMKEMAEKNPEGVRALILECPFGTLLESVKNRFKSVGVPAFPMANMLVFWGGVENGFNAFNFCPENYAKNIKVPTLLIWGRQDPKVNERETQRIYQALAGPKQLLALDNAGHAHYLERYQELWTRTVNEFLSE
jgi:pimeloyl-ACP methyl ester carboxylesterase